VRIRTTVAITGSLLVWMLVVAGVLAQAAGDTLYAFALYEP
jgi:hypothetical protein